MPERRRQLEGTSQPQETTEPLHVKYRPRALADVVGQGDAVKSLRATLASRARPHTYLLVGPAGTGKTTIARIMAGEFGVGPTGYVEVDAASNSGIDAMRALTEALAYQGFGESPNKAIILNECQGLSKQAWDALLTATEEPPKHVYFFFTSTDPSKIPKSMVTRAVTHYLRPVRRDDLLDVLEYVCKQEGLRTPDDILGMVADSCEGSVRGALTMLAKVQDVTDPGEAADMLRAPLEDAEVVELARLLVQGKLTWPRLVDTLKVLEDKPAETCRIIITAYLSSCALGARSDQDAMRCLDMLRAFSAPYNPSDKWAPLLLSFDKHIFG